MNGFLRAVADHTHPLQTKLSLILTDFEPNGNKQAVPLSEKANLIKSALYMPLKINFDGTAYSGHTGAFPIGPITSVFEGEDNGRAVLFGEAIIWNEVYDDISEHLKLAFSEGVGTSWEIYYEDGDVDANGVQWLNGCVFAGTCIVDTPAYGPNRTRVLAVAEQLKMREETLENLMTVQNKKASATNAEPVIVEEVEVIKVTETPEATGDVEVAVAADTMEETRGDIIDTQDLLFQLWEGLDGLYNKTFEVEAANTEKNISKIAAEFADKIGKIANRIGEMRSTAETSTNELIIVKAELDTIKSATDRKEKLDARKNALAEAGIVVSDEIFESRSGFYESMPDDLFEQYVTDLAAVKGTKTVAEIKKQLIPEPIHASGSTSTKEIGAALREQLLKK